MSDFVLNALAYLLVVVAILLAVCGGWFIVAWVVQSCWNILMPSLWTNAPILTYWQSFAGVVLLSTVAGFFKSSSKD